MFGEENGEQGRGRKWSQQLRSGEGKDLKM